MKRIVFFIFYICICLCMSKAETNQYVWKEGRLQYGTTTLNVDSVRYEPCTGQKVRILIPRQVLIQHDSHEIHAIRTQIISVVNDSIIFREPVENTQPYQIVPLFLSNQIDLQQ